MKKMGRLFLFAFVCAAVLSAGSPVYAATTVYKLAGDGPVTLTYKEAVELATEELSEVVTLDGSIQALKDQKRELFGQEKKNKDRQMESMKISQDIAKITAELSLMQSLVDIDNYLMDIGLTEENIALDEENVRRADLKRQYGLASDNDARAAEQQLTQNRVNLDNLNISLSNERQSLNKLLTQPLTREIAVEYEQTISPLPDDLEKYITEMVGNDPVLKQRKLDVDIAKAERDLNEDDVQDSHFDSEYDSAVLERDDAQKALEAAIRANYNNLEQLLKDAASLRVDLDKANDELKTAQVNLNAGMSTQYDVDSAQAAVSKIEVDIEKNLNSYWTLHFSFSHPYLLTE